jgi:hypothetical protein
MYESCLTTCLYVWVMSHDMPLCPCMSHVSLHASIRYTMTSHVVVSKCIGSWFMVCDAWVMSHYMSWVMSHYMWFMVCLIACSRGTCHCHDTRLEWAGAWWGVSGSRVVVHSAPGVDTCHAMRVLRCGWWWGRRLFRSTLGRHVRVLHPTQRGMRRPWGFWNSCFWHATPVRDMTHVCHYKRHDSCMSW